MGQGGRGAEEKGRRGSSCEVSEGNLMILPADMALVRDRKLKK